MEVSRLLLDGFNNIKDTLFSFFFNKVTKAESKLLFQLSLIV